MKYWFALLFVIIGFQVKSQEIKFGKVSKMELEQKASQIDANANAEFIYKSENTYLKINQTTGVRLVKEVHFRIKIFNKEGLDWANHSIILYNENPLTRTNLIGDKGYTYNLVDGKVEKTKLKGEGIFEEKLSDNWRKVSFALPNVREGSVVELKYELEEPFVGSIEDTHLQELIPIQSLYVKIRIPEYFNFKKIINPKAAFYPKLNETVRIKSEQLSNDANSVFNYKENVTEVNLDNVPPLKEERFVDNLQNYVAKIVWEYMYYKSPNGEIKDYSSNWEKVSKTIYSNENFGEQLKKTGYFEKDLESLLSDINDPMVRAATVFQYVKSKVKWNEKYGKYTRDGVRKAYKEGMGNVAEINLMLTAMLRYAGLNANPVLVSTKAHGIPITPTLDGFNYVISAIEVPDDVILLDATSSYALPNVLPQRAINWQGRLIRKNESSTWTSLQQRTPVLDSKTINFEITPDLSIRGKIREHKTLQLAQSAKIRGSKLTDEEKIEELEDRDIEITVDNLEIKDENDYTKPYLRSFDFTSDELLEEIGDKLYVSPLLFYTTEESPFKEEVRNYPIDFVYPFSEKNTVNIKIPDGYDLDYLPESSASKLSDDNISSFKYITRQNGRYIKISVNFDLNYSFIPVADYVAFREYFNAYLEKISEKIVFKKTS